MREFFAITNDTDDGSVELFGFATRKDRDNFVARVARQVACPTLTATAVLMRDETEAAELLDDLDGDEDEAEQTS